MAIEWIRPKTSPDSQPSTPGLAITRIEALPEEAYVVFDELIKESDRGAALLGVAYLDEQLKRLFQAKVVNERTGSELLDGQKPLSTFSARIHLAYGLGWIGQRTYRDINLLRQIRNKFAHLHRPIKFADREVESECSNLDLPKTNTLVTLTARDAFCLTVSVLALQFEHAVKTTTRAQPGLDFYPIRITHSTEAQA